eukprot:3325733-Prymnesium_polylepis.1
MVSHDGSQCSRNTGAKGKGTIIAGDTALCEWMGRLLPWVGVSMVRNRRLRDWACSSFLAAQNRIPVRSAIGWPAGNATPDGRNALVTCGLSTRSCAFGAASKRFNPSSSFNSPVTPAADSLCPRLPLIPLNTNPGHEITLSAPASIGSPSDVPVPCASFCLNSLDAVAPSARAARSKPCCAWPFGAVRLALRPS